MLQRLIEMHDRVVSNKNRSEKRYLFHEINWSLNALCIYGARGTGKTTLMIQHYKEQYQSVENALYITADHVHVLTNGLFEVADAYFKTGGKALYIDEIHKYPNWSVELKNILDVYSDKQVIVSGSSTLDLRRSKGDLSRRLVYYELMGLSFREFLLFEKAVQIPVISIDDLLEDHVTLASDIKKTCVIGKEFSEYLSYGYYPFFLDGKKEYLERLFNVVEKVLFQDIAFSFNLSQPKLPVLKKLLWIIANSEPFVPNIDRIGQNLGISREYVYHYIEFLEKAGLTINLRRAGQGFKAMRKPAKIFLQNSGLIRALSESSMEQNIGTIRECFIVNQLTAKHDVTIPSQGDFLVDGKYVIEVGGRNKNTIQINGISNAWLALDGIEIGFKKTIPLYMFGMLY
jgi:uncharacterized protein